MDDKNRQAFQRIYIPGKSRKCNQNKAAGYFYTLACNQTSSAGRNSKRGEETDDRVGITILLIPLQLRRENTEIKVHHYGKRCQEGELPR